MATVGLVIVRLLSIAAFQMSIGPLDELRPRHLTSLDDYPSYLFSPRVGMSNIESLAGTRSKSQTV